VLNLTLLVN